MASRTVTTLPYTEKEVATGNYDESRTTIDRVIIHTMVGTADSAAARFDDPASKVSAHYGVKLDGTIYHWLEETFTAYHAGDYSVNQRSIGIEHEDNGDYNGLRTDALYETSSKLVRDICLFYNIPIDRTHILKHSEVHPTGCPDALDIDRIVRVAQGGNPPADVHADDLTKMLNWDDVATYSQVDKLDKNGAKLVIAQIETLKGDISTANQSLAEKEAELQTTRVERDKALLAVCPDPSAHTSHPSVPIPTEPTPNVPSVPSTPSGGNNGNTTPTTPSVQTNAFQSIIAFIINLFKK